MRNLMVLAVLLIFCNPNILSADGEVVAYVNQEVLTEKDLKEEMNGGQWYDHKKKLEKDFQGKELIQRLVHLKRKALEKMITDKLIALEGKKLFPVLEQSMIRNEISNRIARYRVNSEDELKKVLKSQNVTWKKFLEDVEEDIRVRYYINMRINRRVKVSPKQVYSFYQQYVKSKKTPRRQTEFGKSVEIVLHVPEMVKVLHLSILPDLSKNLVLKDLKELEVTVRRLSKKFTSFDKKDRIAVENWVLKKKKENPKCILSLREIYLTRDSGIGKKLIDFSFDKRNLNKWSPANMTEADTNNKAVKYHRWDRLKVLEHVEKYVKDFVAVKSQIEGFLNQAATEREMKVLRERLWKTGGVKIINKE